MHSIIASLSGILLTLSSIFTGGQATHQDTPAAVTQSTSTKPASVAALPQGSPRLAVLPLGDGKYTTTGPKKGYIYVCHAGSQGGGAQVVGPWISGTSWDPSQKVAVGGSVSWPNASFLAVLGTSTRILKTNDLPLGHTTGIYPIRSTDPAYAYDRNPSSIKAQAYTFSLPTHPTFAPKPSCIYGEVGVMNTGVMIYDGFDAEDRDAPAHEVQDSCQGHPNEHGYHYHSLSSCIATTTIDTVIGFALDGFPITGGKLPNGNYLHTADLDECHGITSEIVLDGKKTTSYHYVMTEDFPYSVSCFKGASTFKPTPSSQSNAQNGTQRQGGQQGMMPSGPGMLPPPGR